MQSTPNLRASRQPPILPRMTRRHPHAFPLDDQRVYDFYIAGRTRAALAAGDALRSAPAGSVSEQP